MAEIYRSGNKRSAMDNLSQALGIAQSVYGFTTGIADRAEKKEDNAMARKAMQYKLDADADERQGVITQKEAASLAKEGHVVPEGTKGSYQISVRQGDEVKPLFIMPKKASSESPMEQYLKSLQAQKAKLEIDEKRNPKPTSDQSKAAAFAKRIEQAEGVFGVLAEKGYDATTAGAAAERLSIYPEMFKSGQAKQQQQAERNFVNALLRRESGSAISKDEFSSAESQYFPRAGDTPDVLKQKAENRRIAYEGLKSEAGGAYDRIDSALNANPTMVAKKQSAPSTTSNAGVSGGIDVSKMSKADKIKFLQGK